MSTGTRQRARRVPKEPLLLCLPPLEPGPALAHNFLVVKGYALARSGIERVTIEIDGRSWTARHGLPSEDAAELLPGPRRLAARAGFEVYIDTAGWPPGRRELSVRALDRDGREASWSGEVDVFPFEPAPPTIAELAEIARSGRTAMMVEAPLHDALVSGERYFDVSGWALCAAGIERVVVTIDGTQRLDANHSLSRPERSGPDGVDLSHAGFLTRVDPRPLNPGQHWLTVAALGADGTAMGALLRLHVTAGDEPDVPAAPLPESAGDAGEAAFILRAPASATPGPPRPEAFPATPVPARLERGFLEGAERRARAELAASLAPGRRVLDIGAGGGGLLGSAREVPAGVERLPVEDGSVDLAVCLGTLEQAPEPQRLLGEVARVLAPGGLLLVATANRAGHPAGNPSHHHEWDEGELRALLGPRFEQFEILPQQSYVATLIGRDDPGAAARQVTLAAAAAEDSGAEPEPPFLIAIAANGPLPPIGEFAALADPRDEIAAWHTLAAAWEERASWLQTHADASRSLAAHAWLERSFVQEELDAVKGSLSWRMTRPLRRVKALLRGEGRARRD